MGRERYVSCVYGVHGEDDEACRCVLVVAGSCRELDSTEQRTIVLVVDGSRRILVRVSMIARV